MFRQWKASGFQTISRLESKLASLPPAQSTDAAADISVRLIADICRQRRLPGLARALTTGNLGESFLHSTLPEIVRRALLAPSLLPDGVPLLDVRPPKSDEQRPRNEGHAVELTNEQAASLLANMFLSNAPEYRRGFDLPRFDSFVELFCNSYPQEVAKIQMFIHFFERLATLPPGRRELSGHLCFRRLAAPQAALSISFWQQCNLPLRELTVLDDGLIEDDSNDIQVDFANEMIGGGVICGGCVQEEIRFSICPLLTTSVLCCPRMRDHEAMTLTGAEQFSKYEGYAFSMRYGGDHQDQTPRNDKGDILCCITAIDAQPYADQLRQLETEAMKRDLVKALAGFDIEGEETEHWKDAAVASGNWGCGAFGGDPHLKSILQWLAASVAGRRLKYYTFHSGEGFEWGLAQLSRQALEQGVTVGDLFSALHRSVQKVKQGRLSLSRLHSDLSSQFEQAADRAGGSADACDGRPKAT